MLFNLIKLLSRSSSSPSVFVASSYKEFGEIRDLAAKALSETRLRDVSMPDPILSTEIERARKPLEEIIDACQKQAADCDLLILILGEQWGSGITELEFRAARDAGKTVLILFKRGFVSPAEGSSNKAFKMESFREELTDFSSGFIVREFTSEDREEFRALLRRLLHSWLVSVHRRDAQLRAIRIRLLGFLALVALLVSVGLLLR